MKICDFLFLGGILCLIVTPSFAQTTKFQEAGGHHFRQSYQIKANEIASIQFQNVSSNDEVGAATTSDKDSNSSEDEINLDNIPDSDSSDETKSETDDTHQNTQPGINTSTAPEQSIPAAEPQKPPVQENTQESDTNSDESVTEDTDTAASSAGNSNSSSATLLPDISVIGNVVGNFTNSHVENRNKMLLRELEVGIQSYIYPSVKADIFISSEQEEDFHTALEEGYVSILQMGNTPFTLRLGKIRAPFGKLNAFHPHQWPFIDQPYVLSKFLGDDGLKCNGAFLQYLIPTDGKFFANLELGSSVPDSPEETDSKTPVSLFDSGLQTARLWTSKAFKHDLAEGELGLSYATGHTGQYEDNLNRDSLNLMGVDLTYRYWPSTYQRWKLMGEWMRQKRSLLSSNSTANGYYLFAEHQFNQYWSYGLRYDWTETPWPNIGHQSGLTAVLTDNLTEMTTARLQVSHSNDSESGSENCIMLQFLYGMGPHTHPLQ